MYNILNIVDINYLLNYIRLKMSQLLQGLVLFLNFFLSVKCFVIPNNFIVSGSLKKNCLAKKSFVVL